MNIENIRRTSSLAQSVFAVVGCSYVACTYSVVEAREPLQVSGQQSRHHLNEEAEQDSYNYLF